MMAVILGKLTNTEIYIQQIVSDIKVDTETFGETLVCSHSVYASTMKHTIKQIRDKYLSIK